MSSSTSDAADAVREARQRLRSSLDALTEQLSPAGALDLARSIVEDQEARRSAVDFVKKNPVPVGLAATGLAWLGYSLLKKDPERLADPRRDPGLTEVSGRPDAVPPASPPAEPTVAAAGREDVPRVTAPVAPAPPEPSRAEKVVETARGVRATFRRHPLLYGVVGLVAGAVAGVIAVLRGRRDDAIDVDVDPDDAVCADPPADGAATYAAGDPIRAEGRSRGGNGVARASGRAGRTAPPRPAVH